jgi:hypothetical protein
MTLFLDLALFGAPPRSERRNLVRVHFFICSFYALVNCGAIPSNSYWQTSKGSTIIRLRVKHKFYNSKTFHYSSQLRDGIAYLVDINA